MGITFVLYPVLCGRLLLLFHYADFGDVQVLSTDVRPTMLGRWRLHLPH